MSKDPAVLWYWNDWNGGTVTFTRHLKGCYMDLLSAQFNAGPLSLDQIKTVLGQDQASWTVLSKKFKREVNSENIEVFFNERMEAEKLKRQSFSEKQQAKVNKRWRKDTTVLPRYIPKIEDEIEIEDENKNLLKNKNAVFEKKHDYDEFLNNAIWKEQFCMTKKIDLPKLDQLQKYFIEDVKLKGEFIDNLYRYFTNWFNKLETLDLKEKNGSSKINKQQGQQVARARAIEIGKREFAALREANTGG